VAEPHSPLSRYCCSQIDLNPPDRARHCSARSRAALRSCLLKLCPSNLSTSGVAQTGLVCLVPLCRGHRSRKILSPRCFGSRLLLLLLSSDASPMRRRYLARCTNAAQERHYSPSINASCYRDGKRALNFERGPRGINITVGWAGCGLVVPVEEEEPVRQTGVRESEAPASRWLPRSLSVQGGGPSDSGSLQGRCQCQRRAVRNRTRRLGPPTLGRGNGRRWGDRSHDGAHKGSCLE
jgi:hypothetical protein